ncbi:MAG: hypothetical protein ACRD20_01550 [Terriglobales bacterium]
MAETEASIILSPPLRIRYSYVTLPALFLQMQSIQLALMDDVRRAERALRQTGRSHISNDCCAMEALEADPALGGT